jgi:hypothetical protein
VSVEHPIYTAPSYPQWIPGASGNVWPLDRYLNEGTRSTDWLASGVIKRHRTVTTYVNALIAAGFSIQRLDEWGRTAEQIAAHPTWVGERERPPFLLISAQRWSPVCSVASSAFLVARSAASRKIACSVLRG